MKKNITIIVFDFDETLYYSDTALLSYINFIKQAILSLSTHTEEEANKIIHQYGFDSRGENRVSFGKNCENFGVKKQDWEEYKKDHFFEVDYNNSKIVDNSLIKKLSKKYTCLILSNELYENIQYKAKKLGIELSSFDRIYAPTKSSTEPCLSKKEIYTQISKEYNTPYKRIFAIGDRYQVDIKPLVELGGFGAQISNTEELNNLLKTLL